MAGFTDYLEENLLSHIFGGTPYPQPTSINVALLETLPTDDDGTSLVETTGGDYARVEVATWVVSTDVSGLTSAINDEVVDFGAAGTGGWGTISGFGIYDDSVAGNLLMYGEFSFPITVAEGATVTFQVGDLKINLS